MDAQHVRIINQHSYLSVCLSVCQIAKWKSVVHTFDYNFVMLNVQKIHIALRTKLIWNKNCNFILNIFFYN